MERLPKFAVAEAINDGITNRVPVLKQFSYPCECLLSGILVSTIHPTLEDEQSPTAKVMPKNGVQQMIKRPVTTATVVAIRKS